MVKYATMAKITILTYGSRGDVQPMAALGAGLVKACHEVTLAAPGRFKDLAARHGMDFAPLSGDPAALAKAFVDEAGFNPFKTMKIMIEFALPLAVEVWQQLKHACREADLVIHMFMMITSGNIIAGQNRIPEMNANVVPVFFPTREFPMAGMSFVKIGGLNKFTHQFFNHLFWGITKFANNFFVRPKTPDLPKAGKWPLRKGAAQVMPVIYGISPSVVGKPKDWPEQAHLTGYWFFEQEAGWQPSEELKAFLEAGPAPVYIGFGSMVTENHQQIMDTIAAALEISGQRGILLRGWAGLGNSSLPDSILMIEEAQHDWLFPSMAAIVHHGGAGTTAASLRSGVPSIVVPFIADQPFWGDRVYRLGVGPRPIPVRKLTAENLAAAIRQSLQDEGMRAAAADLGKKIQAEDGIGIAVRLIEDHLKRNAPDN